nr:oxidoreductase [Pseudomonadota bacterium]
AYEAGPTQALAQRILTNLAGAEPPDADPASVARAIVAVVDTPRGHRPLRVHVDPSDDGCEVVNAVADRVRAEFLRRIELADLLSPAGTAS